MLKRSTILIAIACLFFAFKNISGDMQPLSISANHRYFMAGDKPFFWLGDTGWLLFSKMNREEAEKYLEIRSKQGFNVIQVMVVHSIKETNAYGDSALINKNISSPKITDGNTFGKGKEYDYWDHVDWIISKAANKGIYIALVPVWGSVVKENHIGADKARIYAEFLAKRYGNRPNVIWMNGGDIAGSDSLNTWNAIGETLKANDGKHLITYHPRGRTQSSKWFHNADWLDFNCFQSGHRTYAQDTSKKDLNYGEDNWRYVKTDYDMQPVKPTLDAEPSYENIPYGLHNIKLPRWKAADVRRYGYWSVFAGACGYTYGNNDVMQMHKPGDKGSAYGSKKYWYQSINDAGAMQMIYLKKIMLSRPYLNRVPDQSIIAGNEGERYNRLIAARGDNYAFVYTYNGRNISINTAKFNSSKLKASWYNPRNGQVTTIGTLAKNPVMKFDPPGQQANGNDWVLIIDEV